MKQQAKARREARIQSLMSERKLTRKQAAECVDLLAKAKELEQQAEKCAERNLLVAATGYRKEATLLTRRASDLFFGVKR